MARAVEAIRAGEVAVVPTDTVYGLAADGTSEQAARRL
ncbi:MAG: Sua5/YciO/YrdC/YwlC family protein, partial [Gaiella sp.]